MDDSEKLKALKVAVAAIEEMVARRRDNKAEVTFDELVRDYGRTVGVSARMAREVTEQQLRELFAIK